MTRYWLMKSEPTSYSIHDLEQDRTTGWDGVRNYQARNFMRDDMKIGDKVLFYHSNASPPGVAGLAQVCGLAHPDPTAFDPEDHHFDPKSDPEDPRWLMVDLEHVETFDAIVPLQSLREHPGLQDMLVLKRAQRLSVQPVDEKHFEAIVEMAKGA